MTNILLTLLSLLPIIIFGYLLVNLFISKDSFFEKLSVGYIVGFGVFTFIIFLANLVGLKYNLLNSILIITVLIITVGLVNIFSHKFCYLWRPKWEISNTIRRFKELDSFSRFLFIFILVLIAISFISNSYWPIKDWDALVMYDFRPKVFLHTGYMFEAAKLGYFISYPLLTSLEHLWLYLFGVTNPMLIYSFYYTSLLVIFYTGMRKLNVEKSITFIFTFLVAVSATIFEHSMWAYTNLPYTVYLVSSVLFLCLWIKDKGSKYWMVSSLLLGLSLWTRFAEPFWLPIVVFAVIYGILNKKIIPSLVFPIIVLVIRYTWINFSSRIIGPGSSGVSDITSSLINNFSFYRVQEVLNYLWVNVFKVNIFLYSVFLFSLIYLPTMIKKKDWVLSFLVYLIVGYFIILLFGTYYFSITEASYWMRIGDSAQRMMMFITPLILSYFCLIIKNYLFTKRSSLFVSEKILAFNRKVFPFLIVITFSFLTLESYKYIGVLSRYIFIDSRYLFALSLISILLIIYSDLMYKKISANVMEAPLLFLNKIFFPLALILYEAMIALEQIKYSNYIYSTFHIQPQNFLNVVYLSLSLFTLGFVQMLVSVPKSDNSLARKILNIWPSEKKKSLSLLLVVLLSSIFAVGSFFKTLNTSMVDLIYIFGHLNYTYDQKMQAKWGIMYSLITMIKEHTPEDASIIFPQSSPPHSVDGRLEYFRSFLGNRKLINYNRDINLQDYDYVVIAKGYLHSVYDGALVNNYIWPDFKVDSDKLYLMNVTEDFHFENSVILSSYNPDNYRYNNMWGLIKIKKQQP